MHLIVLYTERNAVITNDNHCCRDHMWTLCWCSSKQTTDQAMVRFFYHLKEGGLMSAITVVR